MTNPSSEKEGVFDNIKGAHSKDPDVVEEAPVEQAEPEPKPVAEDKSETDRVLRLKQELPNLDRLLRMTKQKGKK
jgi:hypothetical protein